MTSLPAPALTVKALFHTPLPVDTILSLFLVPETFFPFGAIFAIILLLFYSNFAYLYYTNFALISNIDNILNTII